MTKAGFVPRTGQMLGRYQLLVPVANGGMAEVWAARLPGTRGFRKIVAIKTILRVSGADQRFERMFIQEAKLAAQIHHPNVVETIEFAEHHGKLYLVMEFVEGETLGSIIVQANQHGGLPTSVAINVVGQVCKGLHAAHELCDDEGNPLGLVHRDVSPQNMIVSYSGTAKVLDFGVAKATLRMSNLTEAGQLKGKFAYMSPEQLNGQAMDRRSDVFSIGVILYMLTTGRHPFKGDSTDETLRNICSSRPVPPPESIVPNFSPKLAAVLNGALRKRPEERMSSALDVVAALEQAHPECFDTSFETKLSGFMRDLFEERILERRALLKKAEEACTSESEAPPAAAPRAGSEEPAPASPRVSAPRHDAPSPESEPGDPPGASLHAWTPPRSRAVWFFAAVAALGIAAITLVGRHAVQTPDVQRPVPSVDLKVSAASAPTAPASITPQKIAPLEAPPPSGEAAAEEAPARSSNLHDVAPAPRRPERETRARTAPRRADAPARPKASPGAANEAPGQPPPAAPAARKSPVDPWDPSTYGGRF